MRFWDTAAKAGQRSDYWAGALLGRTPEGEWILERVETPTEAQKAAYESWVGQAWPGEGEEEGEAEEGGVGVGVTCVLRWCGAPLDASLRPPPRRYAVEPSSPAATSRPISRLRPRRRGRPRRWADRRRRPAR